MKKFLYLVLSAFMISCGGNQGKQPETKIEQSNIYEVNVRQYTQEGTLKAFEDYHLERL
jgi:hypothetical protein